MPKSNCFSAPELVSKKGKKNKYRCESATDTCKYESSSPLKHEFSLKCECGLNPHGYSYCPRKFEKSYTRTLANITEIFAKDCHTVDRLSIPRCYFKSAQKRFDSLF